MAWDVALAKHIGGRGDQQDHVGASLSDDRSLGLLALADGMGGHRGGALASRLLVETALETWATQSAGAWEAHAVLRDVCHVAHTQIQQQGRQHGLDPHTTCVLLLLEPARATWLHVGDSRCYLVRSGTIVSRTRDHSVVQLLVDMKEVREEDMAHHPDQNKLLRSLGGATEPELEFADTGIREGDGFVLCSDGLWESIKPQELSSALVAPDLQAEADRLVELAAERGGPEGDNISLILARAVKPQATASQRSGLAERLKRLVR